MVVVVDYSDKIVVDHYVLLENRMTYHIDLKVHNYYIVTVYSIIKFDHIPKRDITQSHTRVGYP
jgi:hypothetical protein